MEKKIEQGEDVVDKLLLLNLIFQQFPLLLSYFYFLFLFENLLFHLQLIICRNDFMFAFFSGRLHLLLYEELHFIILYQGPSKKASIAENNIELILGDFVLHEEGTKLFCSLTADASVC